MHAVSASRRARGFTLIEIAIALVVVAALAGGALAALRAQTAYTRSAQVREQLRTAREAILAFAVANGRLPCAASDAAGAESVPCGQRGFLPWAVLGVGSTEQFGSQPLRYLASPNLVVKTFNYNTLSGLDLRASGAKLASSDAVAFAVWSVGEDGISSSDGEPNNRVIVELAGSDDIVELVSRYVMLGRLSNAGHKIAIGNPAASASSSSASSSP